MRSILIRRFIFIYFISFALSILVLITGYAFMSQKTYLDVKINEMQPSAVALSEIASEFITGELSYDSFMSLSDSVSCSEEIYAVIFKSNGTLIYTDYKPVGEDNALLSFDEFNDTLLTGETITSSNFNFGEIKTLVTGLPVYDSISPQDVVDPDQTWQNSPNATDYNDEEAPNIIGMIYVLASSDAVLSTLNSTNATLVVAVFAVLPISVSILLYALRGLAQPLDQIIDTTNELAQGNFTVRADEDAIGEIGTLAKAVNILSANLSETINELDSERHQLKQILSGMSDGFAAVDIDGNLTHYNPALIKLFRIDESEYTPNQQKDLIIPEARELVKEVFRTGEVRTMVYRQPSTDRSYWITVSPVYDDDGQCSGAVGLVKDTTEMERLERMRHEYIANVSHEFRTPLTALRGLLEPLADNMVKDPDERTRYYQIMLREVTRLSRLITDTLSLSKLQADAEKFILEKVDVSDILMTAATNLHQASKENHVLIKCSLDSAVYALTDEDKLMQLVIILVDNAIKYGGEGCSVKLTIDDTADALNGDEFADGVVSNPDFDFTKCHDKLLVRVTDTGIGITAEDLPRVFERFFTVDKPRTKGSTGLGLAIAFHIMQKLDETIVVKSEFGKGTTFAFTLTRYSEHTEVKKPTIPTPKPKPVVPSTPKAEKIKTRKQRPIDAEFTVIDDDKNKD